MAFYGIPTPGLALTASTAGDTIQLFNNSTAVISANTIIGLNGNDIINLGAEGYTASQVAFISGIAGGTGSLATGVSGTYYLSGTLLGQDAIYQTGTSVTYSGLGPNGFSGSVTVAGVITSENAVRRIVASQIYGNQDNDSIALGTELGILSASTIGGGAGNDYIGTYSYVNQQWTSTSITTASLISNSLIDGGGGNDVIRLVLPTGSITTATIQGGAGNDSILIDAVAFQAAQFLGGGDSDVMSGDIHGTFSGSTIAGGGGNDALVISASGANATLLAGDVFNVSDSVYDGNDTIQLNFTTGSSISVQGGGGNDSIVFSALGGANYIAGNLGNDTIFIQTGFSASTVFGGAGNDSILLSGSFVGGSLIFGGGDKDTINFAVGDLASGTLFAGTVFGGLGADKFQASATVTGGGTLGVTFGYSAYADSTISAMDSIAIGTTAASGVYVLDFVPAGLSLGSFSGSLATGSNGVVTFTSTMDTDVTSRYNVINADMTSLGATVTFKDGAGVNYVFIQGGTSDDLIVQVGQTASGATISLNGGKLITIDTL